MFRNLLVVSLMLLSTPAVAQELIAADTAVGFRRFEQQVKTEVGGETGERVVEEWELSAALSGTRRIWRWFSGGAFIRWDIGRREAARFGAFDEQGRATVEEKLGGSFNEFWLGPLIRAQYEWIRAEVGYAVVGVRQDRARIDLPARGDTTTNFRTTKAVAWLASVSFIAPVDWDIRPFAQLDYRVRYYDRRANTPLDGQVVHGTQSFTPLIGLSVRFNRLLPN